MEYLTSLAARYDVLMQWYCAIPFSHGVSLGLMTVALGSQPYGRE